MRWILALIIVAGVFLLTFFRFAPDNVEAVHVAPATKPIGDYEGERSFHAARAITTNGAGLLEAIDRVALQTARTRRLAGSPNEGMITYVTRSAVFGFPDYTTVQVLEDDGFVLQVHGRAKFGKLDLGVNKARVMGWLDQLGPLIVTP